MLGFYRTCVLWQGIGSRVGQTELAKCNEPEGEDAELLKEKKGRGHGRGRGSGRAGRGCVAKSKLRLRSKTPAVSHAAEEENHWVEMTEEEMKEWYIFRGWTEAEVDEWWQAEGWGDSYSVEEPAVVAKRKKAKAKGAVTPEKPKTKRQKKQDGAEVANDQEMEDVKEVSFARRPVPTRASAYTRWSAIKLAFQDKISLYVVSPSKYQARV